MSCMATRSPPKYLGPHHGKLVPCGIFREFSLSCAELGGSPFHDNVQGELPSSKWILSCRIRSCLGSPPLSLFHHVEMFAFRLKHFWSWWFPCCRKYLGRSCLSELRENCISLCFNALSTDILLVTSACFLHLQVSCICGSVDHLNSLSSAVASGDNTTFC